MLKKMKKMKNNNIGRKVVIQGYWGHEPIWREQTPEEKLREANIDTGIANLFIKLNEAQYE
jgi:hypothetical protein